MAAGLSLILAHFLVIRGEMFQVVPFVSTGYHTLRQFSVHATLEDTRAASCSSKMISFSDINKQVVDR